MNMATDFEVKYVGSFPFFLQDYKTINLSWQQRHLQMTPLFAATQLTQTQADFSSIGTRVVRATQQSMAFTPTQGAMKFCVNKDYEIVYL